MSSDEKAVDLEEMLQELQQNSTHIHVVRLQDGIGDIRPRILTNLRGLSKSYCLSIMTITLILLIR